MNILGKILLFETYAAITVKICSHTFTVVEQVVLQSVGRGGCVMLEIRAKFLLL